MSALTPLLLSPRTWPPALRWCLVIVLFIGLALASLLPEAAPSEKYRIDLGLHAFAYAISMVVVVVLTGRPLIWAFVLICYSALLEYAQSFVPGRNGALDDFLMNGVGIALVLVGFLFLRSPGPNGRQ
jgi:VanZ family protein